MNAPNSPQSGEITNLLWALRDGEAEALSRLMYLVYPSLRRLAADMLRHESMVHTLGPTDLVHEMLLALIIPRNLSFENRRHFFTTTARKMRHILIDFARKRRSKRHGGGFKRQDLPDADLCIASDRDVSALLGIHDLIEKLAAVEPRAAEVVELRYFWGFTSAEVAAMVGVTERTVERDWQFARKWLALHLRGNEAHDNGT